MANIFEKLGCPKDIQNQLESVAIELNIDSSKIEESGLTIQAALQRIACQAEKSPAVTTEAPGLWLLGTIQLLSETISDGRINPKRQDKKRAEEERNRDGGKTRRSVAYHEAVTNGSAKRNGKKKP